MQAPRALTWSLLSAEQVPPRITQVLPSLHKACKMGVFICMGLRFRETKVFA